MKKALITGASGFIGTNLQKACKELDIDVTILPREALLDGGLMRKIVSNKHFDYIFHLAAYGNLHSQTSEAETLIVNVLGTFNLLEVTKKIPYKAFINFSSSSILLPTPTMYTASKLSTEIICNAIAFKYDKPIVSVRPSTVYGPGDNIAHLIPQVIHNISYGTQMKLVLEPRHDYIYVNDLIRGLFILSENIKRIQGMAVNISSGKQYSNQQITNKIEKIMNKKLQFSEVNNIRSYDTKDWKVDNRFMQSIGWKPLVTIDEGLKYAVEYEKGRPIENAN